MLNAPSGEQKIRERRAAVLLSASVADAVAVAHDDDDNSPTPDAAIDGDALSCAEQLADDLRDGNLEPDEVTARALRIAYCVDAERAQADYVDANNVANREMDQIIDNNNDDDDDTRNRRFLRKEEAKSLSQSLYFNLLPTPVQPPKWRSIFKSFFFN